MELFPHKVNGYWGKSLSEFLGPRQNDDDQCKCKQSWIAYGINVGDRTQRLQQWPLLVESKIARCYA